ncbi:MAG: flagellar hook capping FlgD N-terminal domain-containing protein [Chloroflexota bacterium]
MPFDITRIATPTVKPYASEGNGTAGTNNGVDTVKKSADASDVFGLTKDDFFKLFLNQLKNQDPTSPMDDKDFLNQMAQFTMIDTLQQVSKSLGGTQLAQASALIGDQVIGTDTSGKAASGVVNRIVQDATGILLVLDGGALVDPKNVTQVIKPSSDSTSGSSTATT